MFTKQNKKFMKRILGVLLFMSLLFLSCKNHSKSKQEPSSKLEKLDIGYSRLRISLPIFVAKEKGFFEKNGIDANLVMFETAQPLMQAIVAGNVDVGGYTALPITYNGMLRSNKDLVFLTTMIEDDKHRISYLLKKKGNTSIKSIKDFKGRTIGILPTIAYKAWIEDILIDNGLDPQKDVKIQQIAPAQQPQALNNGGVDILFTNDPAATSALELNIAENITSDVEVPKYVMDPFPFGSFNVTKEWAESNPELLLSLKKSLNDAIDWAEQNQNEAKQTMIPYLPQKFKAHVSKYPNIEYLRTDESDDAVYNKIADEYFKMGIIKTEIDLTNKVIEN